MSLKLCWPMLNDASFAVGNRAGFILSSVRLRDALADLGVEIDVDAETALHLCHPRNYLPMPGKRNGLLTMCETPRLMPDFAVAFRKADFVLTPSRFCRDVFTPALRGTPCMLSPLGFDPTVYTYAPRAWTATPEIEARYPELEQRIRDVEVHLRGRGGSKIYVDPDQKTKPARMFEPFDPFFFLHVGAPNARKGWDRVINAWSYVFRNEPWAQLVLKTTDENGPGKVVKIAHNVTWDSRYYTDTEMRDLMHMAHCFVGVSHGEGVGLILMEALATGLPVITVKWSGQLDFLNEGNVQFTPFTHDVIRDSEGGQFYGAFADVADLARTMLKVVRRYPVAVAKAERGSREMHARWTWRHAAQALVANLEKLDVRRAA